MKHISIIQNSYAKENLSAKKIKKGQKDWLSSQDEYT